MKKSTFRINACDLTRVLYMRTKLKETVYEGE